MVDIAITAANVVGDLTKKTATTSGATITAGQVVYLDTTAKLADNDDTEAKAVCKGVALNGASAGQPVSYQHSGDITIGGTVVVGTIYCVSSTAGGICPFADLDANDYVSIVGVGTSATVITLGRNNSGAQVP